MRARDRASDFAEGRIVLALMLEAIVQDDHTTFDAAPFAHQNSSRLQPACGRLSDGAAFRDCLSHALQLALRLWVEVAEGFDLNFPSNETAQDVRRLDWRRRAPKTPLPEFAQLHYAQAVETCDCLLNGLVNKGAPGIAGR